MSDEHKAAMSAMHMIKRGLRDRMMRKVKAPGHPESGHAEPVDESDVHDDENQPHKEVSDHHEGIEHEERLEQQDAVDEVEPGEHDPQHEPVMEEKRTVLESFVPKRSGSQLHDMPENMPHHSPGQHKRGRGRPRKY